MVLLPFCVLLYCFALSCADSESGSDESEEKHRKRNRHSWHGSYPPTQHTFNHPAYTIPNGPAYNWYPPAPLGYGYPGNIGQHAQFYTGYISQQTPAYSHQPGYGPPPQQAYAPPQGFSAPPFSIGYAAYAGQQPPAVGYYPNAIGQQASAQQPVPYYYPQLPQAAPATSSATSSSTTTVINGKTEPKTPAPTPVIGSGTEYVYHPIGEQRPGDIVYVLGGQTGQPSACTNGGVCGA